MIEGLGPGQTGALVLVTTGAFLFRLTLLGAGLPHGPIQGSMLTAFRADLSGRSVAYERFLIFDDDIWRYLWDGHVWAGGVNPYRFAPQDPAVDGLSDGSGVWNDIRHSVNHASTPTIYPPLAEGVFRASHWVAPGSVLVMKGVLTGFDMLACLFVGLALQQMGRPAVLAVVYAWNPLVIKAFSGSGHVDALIAASLAACAYFLIREFRTLATVTFAAAVLVKMAPLILLPFFARRVGFRYSAAAVALIVAGYLPFRDAGWHLFTGLLAFGTQWQFNAGPYAAFRMLSAFLFARPDVAARILSALAIGAVVVWAAWGDDCRAATFAGISTAVLGFSILLGPVVMPWYIASLLPLAAISGDRFWGWCSALVSFAFLVMIDGTERSWALIVEYGILMLALYASERRRRQICWKENYK